MQTSCVHKRRGKGWSCKAEKADVLQVMKQTLAVFFHETEGYTVRSFSKRCSTRKLISLCNTILQDRAWKDEGRTLQETTGTNRLLILNLSVTESETKAFAFLTTDYFFYKRSSIGSSLTQRFTTRISPQRRTRTRDNLEGYE